MNIYLLEVKDQFDGGYDSYDAHVVQARTAKKARQLCKYADEGDIWIAPKCATIRLIGVNKQQKEKVILSSFNAG